MACILKHFAETTIQIPKYQLVDGTTFYDIHVNVGKINWTVQHRFKEFVELNDKLVTGHSISSDLLPPKKVSKDIVTVTYNFLLVIQCDKIPN